MAKTPDEPLTLTVHSLPRADAADTGAMTRSGRWKMLALLLVSASPVIASYLAYYVIRPEGRRNYGELIDPQRPLPALTGVDAGGKEVALTALKDQWLFISVADSACDGACQQHLYLQRQLRETLGRERDRIDKVWLVVDETPLRPEVAAVVAAAPPVTVLRVPRDALADWLAPAAGGALEQYAYIVDPMGRWMLRVPPDPDAGRFKRDVERLLRASASWDRAGR